MLYQPQPKRQIVLNLLRRLVAIMGAAIGNFRQTNADTAYVDSLNAHQLSDLGLRRIDDARNRRYY